LAPQDVEEFASWVMLKLVEDDYDVLHKFQGRCSLSSYLYIVIHRLLDDFRNRLWGKWRPSALSERLGPLAVRVETLISRDGHDADEAFRRLRSSGEEISRSEFDALAAGVRPRRERLQVVEIGAIEQQLGVSIDPLETLEGESLRSAAGMIAETLREALAALEPEDRAIIRMHFDAGLTVAEIARSLHLQQKPLYRRIRSVCERLRRRLVNVGINKSVAEDVIGRADVALDFGFGRSGNGRACPSNDTGRESRAEDPPDE
jgi:RNA polymerase sigma factor (sigma-70 family)